MSRPRPSLSRGRANPDDHAVGRTNTGNLASSSLRPAGRVTLRPRCLGALLVEILEQPYGGGDQPLARALGAAGADHLVVTLVVGPARRDVADGTVGQLGDDRARERGVLLDRQAQLREDL